MFGNCPENTKIEQNIRLLYRKSSIFAQKGAFMIKNNSEKAIAIQVPQRYNKRTKWRKVVNCTTKGPRGGNSGVRGEFQHNIDAKGRLFIPAKFRESLGSAFVVTKGLDGCLFVYSLPAWNVLEEKINRLPMSQSRDLQRFFCSSAADCAPDAQGRVVIPQNLRQYAGLTKETTIIGVSGRVEIWDTQRWNQYNGALTPEAIAQAMEQLGF